MGKTILILEDQGGILFPLGERLEKEGFEPILAGDIFTANQALEDFRPHALIVDLNMDPAGLDSSLYRETLDGQLTGWIWLRQYPACIEKAVIYSAYLATLVAQLSQEDMAVFRNIRQISKRQEGHVDAVIAAIKEITQGTQ